MIRDLKFAVRLLFKAPGFTASAVIVLALGIGVNTAVFDLVHKLLFALPPFSRPAELVQVFSQDKTNPTLYRGFSYPTYRDIRGQNDVFTDVMAFDLFLVGLGQKGDTRRTFASTISSNYFPVLGVPFRRTDTDRSNSEILVFITPRIVQENPPILMAQEREQTPISVKEQRWLEGHHRRVLRERAIAETVENITR